MSTPTIDQTQSVLGFFQNQAFSFQPGVSNQFIWKDVTSLTETGGTATLTVSAGHGLGSTGSVRIRIVGSDVAAYNSGFLATINSSTELQFAIAGSPGTSGGVPRVSKDSVFAATGLPSGVTVDQNTGLIAAATGVATAGVYVFGVQCANVEGWGATQNFTLGIEAGSASADWALNLWFDMESRNVFKNDPTVAGAAGGQIASLYFKANDVVPVRVRFTRGNLPVNMDDDGGGLSALALTIKKNEPESPLVEVATESWTKVGDDELAYWEAAVSVSGALLEGALSDEERDSGTQISVMCELAVTFEPDTTEYSISSRNFGATIERDLER